MLAGCASPGGSSEAVRTVIVTVQVDRAEVTPAVEEGELATPVSESELDIEPAVAPEGFDIVDLLDQDLIEIETRGSSIDEVDIDIRRKGDEDLKVRIPPGTYFVSGDPSAQNMVSRRLITVDLTHDGWETVSVPAACANIHLGVPGGEDTFTVQASPFQFELEVLVESLADQFLGYAVEQAAIWILTDNADYDDLGTLITGFTSFSGTRMINEREAAQAMYAIDQAGIDITTKAIWEDRQIILSDLEDPELIAWLEERPGQEPTEAALPDYAGDLGVLAFDGFFGDLAYAPDGGTLAVSSCEWEGERCGEGLVLLFDARSREQIGVLRGHTGAPYNLVWSPDGSLLASGGCGERDDSRVCILGEIYLWDVATQAQIRSYEGVQDWVLDIDFSADGNQIAAPVCTQPGEEFFDCEVGEVYTWDVNGAQEFNVINTGDNRLIVEISPTEEIIAVSDGEGIDLLELSNGDLIRSFEPQPVDVYDLSWSPDGDYLAVYGDVITFWDVETGGEAGHIDEFNLTAETFINTIAWLPNRPVLAVALCHQYGSEGNCEQGEIRMYDAGSLGENDPAAGALVGTIPGIATWEMDISPDGGFLAYVNDRADVVRIIEMPALEN